MYFDKESSLSHDKHVRMEAGGREEKKAQAMKNVEILPTSPMVEGVRGGSQVPRTHDRAHLLVAGDD